jgi:hypothetical protein
LGDFAGSILAHCGRACGDEDRVRMILSTRIRKRIAIS